MSGQNFVNSMIRMPYESMITSLGKTEILMNLQRKAMQTRMFLWFEFKIETEQFPCQSIRKDCQMLSIFKYHLLHQLDSVSVLRTTEKYI